MISAANPKPAFSPPNDVPTVKLPIVVPTTGASKVLLI